MAQFEGTIKEFTKFVGAYARNKVFYITSKYKKEVGKCEDCESMTKGLEAAHVNGLERPILISNILSQFIDGDIIKIDLNEFEERFIQAHTPLEKTIRILCKECHRKYDNMKQVHEMGTEEQGIVNATNLEKEEAKEALVIEELVKNKSMNKTKALEIGETTFLTYLNNSNTIFSNIISNQDVWWLEPKNNKFQSDLYFILNDDKNKTLYFFSIPAGSIKDPESHFRQRNDQYRKGCSDIYIPLSASKFVEKNGFDFTNYLVEKLKY
jgi:hypothetical protein